MSSYIISQYVSKASIERSYENYKKSPKDRLAKESYLVTRLETLENQWKVFTDVHRKLISDATEALLNDKYFSEDIYECVEETYINYKSEIKEALSLIKQTINIMSETGSHTVSKNDFNVKLPKISIPIFTGAYQEWTTFRDLYVSLIHNNSSLDSVQKMHYLKAHLSGEAELLLRHVPITTANYQESWSTLNNRYNNKKYLANCLLMRFMNRPNVGTESCGAIKDLLNVTNDTLNGLKNLGINVDSWDTIVIYIVCTKLDHQTRKNWKSMISICDELPTIMQLKEFLESRFRSLEFLDNNQKLRPNSSTHKKVVHMIGTGSNATVKQCCPYCKKNDHKLAHCKQFYKADYNTRHKFVQTDGSCFNCLGRNHSASNCRSVIRCRICKSKHHSSLHRNPVNNSFKLNPDLAVEDNAEVSSAKASFETPESTSDVAVHFSKKAAYNQVLVATALVKVQARNGHVHVLRALVDPGAQASFVTESTVQLLGLKKTYSKTYVTGLQADKSIFSTKHIVTMTVQSHHDPDFQVKVHAHVLKTITSFLPSRQVLDVEWPEFANITLADPQFHTPSKVDILLGSDVYGQLIREGVIQGPNGTPTAQRTALGWILSGPTHQFKEDNVLPTHSHHSIIVSMHSKIDDNEMLKRFWQIESDTFDKNLFTEEEQRCEEFYSKTTQRDTTGRYIVRLPFRSEDPQCKYGNSRDIALKRFHLLERRFKKNPEVKARYSEVIHEYVDLGHMQRITKSDRDKSESVYLPHHAVIREDKATTKVRVVFDASCKGTNGVSLNDTLMIGPTLQQDLRHIIMRWRMHPICISADIVKMYRQVIVSDEDADFQRLVWRDDPEAEMEEYKLVRVTFGTAPAPYLAVKTLQQLALDEGKEFPKVAGIIKTDFYVDDLLTGCEGIDEGKEIYEKIKNVLRKGGFDLQKGVTNNKDLAKIISDSRENQEGKVDIRMDEVVKVLGLSWDKESDSFHYSVQLPDVQYPITKRKVVSSISRLFDPLGWASPCVIVAKVMIQKLWLAGIGWDDVLPTELLKEWLSYQEDLIHLRKLSIPRWVKAKSDDACRELQGFCDASNTAYAAVVYLRTIDAYGNVHVNLITSKTKVAPTMQVSIPRLELMGAVLLAKLITDVANVLGIDRDNLHAWTDSTVVLAWLSSHPSRWTTFIANRTSTILSKLENTHWSHVQSVQNPADIASRGCTPLELVENSMWLQGPSWLQESNIAYKRPRSLTTELEQKRVKVQVAVAIENTEPFFWLRFSSLQRLIRVVAFCRRFIRYKRGCNFEPYITSNEMDEALQVCIKQCQLMELNGNTASLKPLNPFTDDKGITRVGGRIHNSTLPDSVKHPIILPHKSHFTNLVVDEAHRRTLHGGPTLMLSHLRTRYWILSAKSLVKSHVHKCVVCVRQAAITKNQLMGQLPSSRVTPARPFLHSGVDFAGPIDIRISKGRGNKSYKGYIGLFICMSTKAIHLEVISNLTSESFIAGFKRFVARRGYVSDIWSDNGTNFVGASKELHRLVTAEQSAVAIEIKEWLSKQSVSWHFIPAHAPNFGGLWEAGVKSTKYHLKRVIGNSTLTYEELATVLTQIEACLNSRPLSLLPDDTKSPLTPGHFLIGEPLVIVPDRSYEQSNIGILKRWQLTQRMLQNFWRRWSNEYLVYCLQRYKWSKMTPEPKIGDVVLVKEDNLPPARWLLGRVVAKHPGLDSITRVVTLKCNGSNIRRPTSKLCILPVTD